jgi:hypothetical protein
VLLAIWAASPLVLYIEPTLFGLFRPYAGAAEFIRRIGQIWLFVGASGLIFRSVQLFFIKDIQTGLVWATKILTDPFHDIKLYYKAPLHLLHRDMMDPVAIDHRG